MLSQNRKQAHQSRLFDDQKIAFSSNTLFMIATIPGSVASMCILFSASEAGGLNCKQAKKVDHYCKNLYKPRN